MRPDPRKKFRCRRDRCRGGPALRAEGAARRGAWSRLPSGRESRPRKSRARSALRPESLAFGGRQCRRPAIMRWITSQSRSLGWDLRRIAFDADGDAFADAAQLANGAALDGSDGRVRGAQNKNALQAHALQRSPKNARLERGEIGGNVGQFRHCFKIAARTRRYATDFFMAQRRIALSMSRVDTNPRRDGEECARERPFRPARAWLRQRARCSRCAALRARRQTRHARRREAWMRGARPRRQAIPRGEWSG